MPSTSTTSCIVVATADAAAAAAAPAANAAADAEHIHHFLPRFNWTDIKACVAPYRNLNSAEEVCAVAASGKHPAYIVVGSKVYDLALHGDHFFKW